MRTKTTAMSKAAVLAIPTALSMLALAAPAGAAPILDVSSSHYPPAAPAGTYVKYTLKASNTGDASTDSEVTVEFDVPPGLEITSVTDEFKQQFQFASAWSCSILPGAQSVSCTGPNVLGASRPIEPGKEACQGLFGVVVSCRILVMVRVDSGVPVGTVTPTVEACGGGASCANASDPTEVVPFKFHLERFDGKMLEENGDPATQAGSYPYTASNEFFFNTRLLASGEERAVENLKDAAVEFPPGLLANPQAYPTCTEEQLTSQAGSFGACPPETQIGTVTIWGNNGTPPGQPKPATIGVYNLQAPQGTPAVFGFNISGAGTHIYAEIRSGADYGANLAAKNAPELLPFSGVSFKFWGVPADPSHDAERFCAAASSPGCTSSLSVDPKPFVSLPTSCLGATETDITASGWLGGLDISSFLSHDNTEPTPNPIGNVGCNALDFSPTLEARPTTTVADAPSGLDVDLHIPQNEDPEGTAEAHLRDTTVTLPDGLVINPSGANGLGGCSLTQFGFTGKEGGLIHTTPNPASCPDASKLGTVEVDTPLVDHPLKGAVYAAAPYANPFDSLLAIYLAVDDQQTGVVVKLAGEVHADPSTGRLTTTFEDSPQQPFEDFKLHFFGGAGGVLRTPAVCGQYTTSSSMTPWSAPESGPPDTPSDTWAITQAPGGGTCPGTQGARPNTPDLDAGTVSPIAGAFSPMVINLRREDGSQNFSTVTLTPPPGLLGRLAGVPYCAEGALATAAAKSGQQEIASPSCPAASQLGTVDVAAGAGPAPYHAQGKAYLTGPYKGAPLSLAIITPATAGPFDLGTVVVRTALQVDPASARITAVSDPIPTILQGIPLDVRTAQINLSKPSFTLNPTSCNPLSFSGSLLSTLGQAAPLTERFQVGECGRLAFKPKLGFKLKGGTRRGAHPALNATLTMPAGGANIAKAVVALPHSEFLDQSHIGTVCTRVQYAARECPAGSVYGQATAFSPLLDQPLSGPVYLRSSNNKLPDLVAFLDGQIHVDLVGRVDSIKGGIRTTFEGVPDAPVTKFVLAMQGGRKGLLQNSTNICKGKHLATAEFEAQNGKVADLAPALKNSKCGKKGRKGKRGAKRAP